MKPLKALAVVSVVVVALASLLSGPAGAVSPAGTSNTIPNLKGVRAEYYDSVFGPEVETTVHIINTSLSTPLILRSVFVLGPEGINDIIAAFPGGTGTVIEPLGQIRFGVDSLTIPGVTLGVDPSTAGGVRSVVVEWEGPDEAMDMRAVIRREYQGDTDGSDIVERGYDIHH